MPSLSILLLAVLSGWLVGTFGSDCELIGLCTSVGMGAKTLFCLLLLRRYS